MSDLHAVLVGIDRYRPRRLPGGGIISDLQACTNDVERMEAFLRAEPVALPAERIRTLVSPPSGPFRREPAAGDLPTYENLLRELEALCERAGEGDRVLIHYSGHGVSLPTAVPNKKGPWGRDEALVPCDAAEGEGRFLRDVELYEILQRLAAKKVQATLILDCCHSGGITRDIASANVRGLGEVAAPVPAESLLGSWEELAAAYSVPADQAGDGAPQDSRRRPGEVTRNLIHTAGWFPQPEGCVLLAACRPTELAREYAFDGCGWSGALTHFLLESVGDLGSRPTYRWLHHRLLGRIRNLFDTQTPLLEGDGDLLFLGRETWPARRGIAVLAVEGEGAERKVQIAAGRAQGLGKGARLAVAARQEQRDGTGEGDREPMVELEVTKLGATTSWARVVGGGPAASPPEPGDLASVVDPGKGARKYPIRALVPDGGEAGRGTGRARGPLESLRRLQEALETGAHPLLTSASERAAETEAGEGLQPEYQVEVTPNGSFQILDPSGEPIPHQGRAIPATDPDAEDRLIERLAHLASYRERARLDNPDRSSPLAGKLRLELYRIEDIDDWQDPDEREPVPEGATVPEGTLLCLLVTNDSPRELYFAVLDLQPDWGIAQVHPGPGEGHYTALRPSQAHPVYLEVGLPEWMNEGRDRLKVIATTGPLDATSLELHALGESKGYRSVPGIDPNSGPTRDLRDQLFSPTGPGGAFRTMETLTPVSHEWGGEGVEVGVGRASLGG